MTDVGQERATGQVSFAGRDGRRAWLALALVLGLGSLAAAAGAESTSLGSVGASGFGASGFGASGVGASGVAASGFGATQLDWQPALAWREPWRSFTAAFVHFSPLHLGANLAGLALVAAFGRAAQVSNGITAAWLLAWPLTQLGLLARPDLLHYGGLSGVLHAGVACAATSLAVASEGRRRLIGIATLAVLGLKVGLEAPWGPALRFGHGWDIAVAPFAHLSGLVAGVLTALVALAVQRRPVATPA